MLSQKEIEEMDAITGLQSKNPEQDAIKMRLEELKSLKQPKKSSLTEKIGNFTGGTKLAQGLGQALAQKDTSKMIEETQRQQIDLQGQLLQKIREKKALGEDTSRLEGALEDLGIDITKTAAGAEKLLNPNELTEKQVIGDTLQLATTLGTIGGLSGTGAKATGTLGKVPGLTKQGTGIATELAGKITGGGVGSFRGAAQGGLAGLGQGIISGGLMGTAQGLKEDKDLEGILKDTGTGAFIGGVSGGVLGSIIGGVSGGVKSSQLRKQILDGQISLGEKTKPDLTKLSGIQKKAVDMARTQGFADEDIEFIMSMKPQDKTKAQKMIDLAEKASKNKRSLERPIDVVGDSMLDRVKFIQKQNSTSGKAVDATARALKGQKVDATPVREKALSLLEDAGVYANPDGTPNWSKSIFNKTPELKNKIMKTLSDLPAGEMDAYDLHNFKKSIDEVVNYGVKGEGLKGKSASILKAVRSTADDVLDTNFVDYNKANTDYKTTRDVLEVVQELFGKKAGISKERGGQLLRSVFSNNASRQRVLSLVEQLDKVSKQYGGKYTDNLLDQALFTEILEDVYGTQATTSLQGQVARAVKGTKKVIEGVRDPIKGAGELLATGAEKIAGISPENKKKILSAFVK